MIDPKDPCGRKLPSGSNLLVETQADADTLASCTETDANLIISNGFPGDFECNLQQILNSLYIGTTDRANIESTTLTSVSFPALTYVNNNIQILNASGLIKVSMPILKTVQGEISVTNTPALTQFEAFTRLQHVSYVSIINTGLHRLEWLRYGHVPTLISFLVSNNTNLDEVSIPALENISGGGLYIHGNGRTKVYNNLRYVNFIEMTGVSGWLNGTTGFDSLERTVRNGASYSKLQLWDNTFEILGIPYLEYVNGSISIRDNPYMTSMLICLNSARVYKTANPYRPYIQIPAYY